MNGMQLDLDDAPTSGGAGDDWWTDAVSRFGIDDPFPEEERLRQQQRLDRSAAELLEFQHEQLIHHGRERRIMWKEVVAAVIVGAVAVVRQRWLT